MVLLLYELFFWLPSLSVVGVSLVVLRTTESTEKHVKRYGLLQTPRCSRLAHRGDRLTSHMAVHTGVLDYPNAVSLHVTCETACWACSHKA